MLRNFYKHFRREDGVSTVEILVALVVIILVITSVILVVFGNQTISADSLTNNEALRFAQSIMQKAQTDAAANYNSVNSTSATTDPSNFYTSKFDTTDISPCFKELFDHVTYTIGTRTQYVDLASYASNPKEAIALGGDCLVDPPGGGSGGNWDNPTTFAKDNFNPGKPTGIDVLNKIVYMSGDKAPFLFVADTTSAVLGQSGGLFISFSNGFNAGVKLNAIDVAKLSNGRIYAFVARNASTNQFQIIDVTDFHNPTSVKLLTLAGTVPPSGSFPEGYRVYYYKDFVYVVTRETTGYEFHIINVSVPSAAFEVGTGAELNRTVNSLFVADQTITNGTTRRFAYIASDSNQKELSVLDVTNPSSITELAASTINLSGNQDGKSVYLLGSKLYFGRDDANEELYVYNAFDPTLGLTELAKKDIGGGAIGLRVSGKFVFIASSKTNKELQIWNSQTLAQIATFNFPNVVESGLDYAFDYVYAASQGNDALRIIYSP